MSQLFVKTPAGKTIVIEVLPKDTTISQVKSKIENIEGTPPEHQELTYDSNVLDNDRTVAESGIPACARLTLRCIVNSVSLKIKSATGDVLVLEQVKHTDTVVNIKMKLCTKIGMPLEKQCLMYNAEELQNSLTVEDYFRFGQLKHGSTIDLAIKLQINVKDMNGEEYNLQVKDTDKVEDVISRVADKYPGDEHLRLVFLGEQLSGSSNLASCGMSEGSTVLILEKLSDEALPHNIGRLSLQKVSNDTVQRLESEVKQLPQVRINPSVGTQIGSGSYGIVHKVQHRRKQYAVKRIDPALQECVRDLDSNNKLQHELRKFALRECILLSKVQHHNIVQFHGVCLTDDNVLIVMEYLPMSLTSCLESYPNFQLPYKYRIICDAASGLDYLHSRQPALVHRDISANNIMLTSDLTAKLVDLGSSVLAGTTKEGGRMSPCPGAMVCMPPEAMKPEEETDYDEKLDVFSLGVVIMHIVTQNWPIPPEHEHQLSAEDEEVAGVPEMQKRLEYLQEMREILGANDHLLIKLAISCLQSNPQDRPSATKIVYQMEQLTNEYPASNPLETFETVVKKKLHTDRLQQASPLAAPTMQRRKWVVSNLEIEARRQLHTFEKQKPRHAASHKIERVQEDAVPTLQLMLQELIGISHHYFDIGILLGIGYNKLQQITLSNPNDLNRCLIMVLEEYQKNNDKPTWLAIVNSVEAIGQVDIANKIRTTYCSQENSSHRPHPEDAQQAQPVEPDLRRTLSDMQRQIEDLQTRLQDQSQPTSSSKCHLF